MFYDTLRALVLGFALSGAVQACVSSAHGGRSGGLQGTIEARPGSGSHPIPVDARPAGI